MSSSSWLIQIPSYLFILSLLWLDREKDMLSMTKNNDVAKESWSGSPNFCKQAPQTPGSMIGRGISSSGAGSAIGSSEGSTQANDCRTEGNADKTLLATWHQTMLSNFNNWPVTMYFMPHFPLPKAMCMQTHGLRSRIQSKQALIVCKTDLSYHFSGIRDPTSFCMFHEMARNNFQLRTCLFNPNHTVWRPSVQKQHYGTHEIFKSGTFVMVPDVKTNRLTTDASQVLLLNCWMKTPVPPHQHLRQPLKDHSKARWLCLPSNLLRLWSDDRSQLSKYPW